MKQSDWGIMIAIGVISAAIAIWGSNMILGNPDDATYELKYIADPISSDVAEPSVDLFNINMINPTVDVYVGSCKDLDGDGQISNVELQACNEISGD